MKKFILLSLLTGFFPGALQSALLKIDNVKIVQQGYRQSGAGKLTINNSDGNIEIKGWDIDSVDIIVKIKVAAENETELANLFEQLIPKIEKNGDEIQVITRRNKLKRTKFFGMIHESVYYSYSIAILVPAGLSIITENRFGNTAIIDTRSEINVENYTGDVMITNARGTAIINRYGETTVSKLHGALTLEAYDGPIQVTDIHGEVRVNNHYGDIEVADIGGLLFINNYDGDVRLLSAQEGANIKLKYSDLQISSVIGNLNVENYSGKNVINEIKGDIVVDNKYGSIDISNIDGSLQVSNYNDDIRVENINGSLKADCKYGGIYAVNVSQSTSVDNYSGKISLKKIAGPITANNHYGDILLTDVIPEIRCIAYSGNIKADKIRGGIADINFESTYGNVELAFSNPVSATCNLEIQYGQISLHGAEWNILKSDNKTSVSGILGDGSGQIIGKIYSGDFNLIFTTSD